MNIGAVIILFHPDVSHIEEMLTQLGRVGWPVVLVDNSPVTLKRSFSASQFYIHCSQNIGIAAAQNKGLRKLASLDLDVALILDQDSQLTPSLLTGLATAYEDASNHFPKVAAVGPKIVCEFDGQPVSSRVQKVIRRHQHLAVVNQIIASGMMLDLHSANDIGYKDESLFIDGVDHEWCWRARKEGFVIVQAQNVHMHHRQGDARHRIFGLNFKRGAPVRLYYQVRNVLVLSRRSYVPLYWKLRHIAALPVRWVVNRWYFPEGKKRGDFILRGLRDGIKGKTGKLD